MSAEPEARTEETMIRDAQISDCGRYRYRLFRCWDPGSVRMPLLWLMLNPSTADASIDDPTIKRCIGFSQGWGYGSLLVGNLYAFRSTDPDALLSLDYETAVGPENDYHLDLMAQRAEKIVCAWGNPGIKRRKGPPLCPGGWWHLGLTKSRQPKHPLYLRSDTQLAEFQ